MGEFVAKILTEIVVVLNHWIDAINGHKVIWTKKVILNTVRIVAPIVLFAVAIAVDVNVSVTWGWLYLMADKLVDKIDI